MSDTSEILKTSVMSGLHPVVAADLAEFGRRFDMNRSQVCNRSLAIGLALGDMMLKTVDVHKHLLCFEQTDQATTGMYTTFGWRTLANKQAEIGRLTSQNPSDTKLVPVVITRALLAGVYNMAPHFAAAPEDFATWSYSIGKHWIASEEECRPIFLMTPDGNCVELSSSTEED